MFIPKKVKEYADELRKERLEKVEKARLTEQMKLKEKMALLEEKNNRRKEVLANLNIIFEWLNEFCNSEECKNIVKSKGRVMLFAGRFWLGKPVPEDQITTCAVVELESDFFISYAEKYKGYDRIRFNLLKLDTLRGSAEDVEIFLDNLHPDLIKQWAEEIKSGKVWERVLSS